MSTGVYSREHRRKLLCRRTAECTFSAIKRIAMEVHIRSKHGKYLFKLLFLQTLIHFEISYI